MQYVFIHSRCYRGKQEYGHWVIEIGYHSSCYTTKMNKIGMFVSNIKITAFYYLNMKVYKKKIPNIFSLILTHILRLLDG